MPKSPRNLLLIAAATTAIAASGCSSLATSPSWVGGTMAESAPTRIAAEDAAEKREREAVENQPKVIGAKHILIMHRDSLAKGPGITRTKTEALARAQEVLAKLKAGADFDQLVREYTDEPGAGDRGGDLGVFDNKTMVPQFTRAAFALHVGETSNIIETKFGYHIIRRTE